MSIQKIDSSSNTYAKLFPEKLANTCSTDAPEADSSPIAYLHALYQARPSEQDEYKTEVEAFEQSIKKAFDTSIEKAKTIGDTVKKLLELDPKTHTKTSSETTPLKKTAAEKEAEQADSIAEEVWHLSYDQAVRDFQFLLPTNIPQESSSPGNFPPPKTLSLDDFLTSRNISKTPPQKKFIAKVLNTITSTDENSETTITTIENTRTSQTSEERADRKSGISINLTDKKALIFNSLSITTPPYNLEKLTPKNLLPNELRMLEENLKKEYNEILLPQPTKTLAERRSQLSTLKQKIITDIHTPNEYRLFADSWSNGEESAFDKIEALLDLEQRLGTYKKFPLALRRPDIGELLLDPKHLEHPVTALTLAIRALARQAQKHAGPEAHIPEVLANTGQHADLPFHHAKEQIKAVLKQRKIPLFELLQKTDYSYPNFCNGRLRTQELREVMLKASGFSPALQAILLAEKPLRSKGDEWRAWYGFDCSAKTAIEELLDVENYCRRTGLTIEQVLEMLAVSGIDDNASAGFSAVQCSTAYKPTPPLGHGALPPWRHLYQHPA